MKHNCSGCPLYHVKAVFCLLPHLYWGIKVYGKLNMGKLSTQKSEEEFSMQEVLNCPPDTILCLCNSFLSLFLISSISNPHALTLERANPQCHRMMAEVTPKKRHTTQLDEAKTTQRTVMYTGPNSSLQLSFTYIVPVHSSHSMLCRDILSRTGPNPLLPHTGGSGKCNKSAATAQSSANGSESLPSAFKDILGSILPDSSEGHPARCLLLLAAAA